MTRTLTTALALCLVGGSAWGQAPPPICDTPQAKGAPYCQAMPMTWASPAPMIYHSAGGSGSGVTSNCPKFRQDGTPDSCWSKDDPEIERFWASQRDMLTIMRSVAAQSERQWGTAHCSETTGPTGQDETTVVTCSFRHPKGMYE